MLAFGLVKMICTIPKYGLEKVTIKYWLIQSQGVWFLGDLVINTVLVMLILTFLNGKISHDWKFFLFAWPFAFMPRVGYGGQGIFMYMYFVAGYIIDAYYRDRDFSRFKKYVPYSVGAFVAGWILYCILPITPTGFLFSIRQFSWKILVNDIIKVWLGFSGCFIALVAVRYFYEWRSDGWLHRRAAAVGRYTLDIYLLNIIILEIIGGENVYPWLIQNVCHKNILQDYGLGWEIISTFLTACLMMEIIIAVSRFLNLWPIVAKFFFYRDVKKGSIK